MKYNLYETNLNNSAISFDFINHKNDKLAKLLDEIQVEIIHLYIQKQTQQAGILKLGNEMRYSPSLNSYFENPSQGFYLIKSTENSRYFLTKFIEATISLKEKEIYFVILEDSFGKESKLVDNSFIRINQIKKEILDFFTIFQPRHILPRIFFIEITGFTDYFFENRNGFNYIHKLNNHE